MGSTVPPTGEALRVRRRIASTAMLVGCCRFPGCASFPGDQTPPDDSIFKSARYVCGAPEGLNDGFPGKSCGEVTLNQGEQISRPARKSTGLDSANGRLDAGPRLSRPLLRRSHRVWFSTGPRSTPQAWEVSTDGEHDRYGPKTWTQENRPETTTLIPPQAAQRNRPPLGCRLPGFLSQRQILPQCTSDGATSIGSAQKGGFRWGTRTDGRRVLRSATSVLRSIGQVSPRLLSSPT
jgi:hypothetical protein